MTKKKIKQDQPRREAADTKYNESRCVQGNRAYLSTANIFIPPSRLGVTLVFRYLRKGAPCSIACNGAATSAGAGAFEVARPPPAPPVAAAAAAAASPPLFALDRRGTGVDVRDRDGIAGVGNVVAAVVVAGARGASDEGGRGPVG